MLEGMPIMEMARKILELEANDIHKGMTNLGYSC